MRDMNQQSFYLKQWDNPHEQCLRNLDGYFERIHITLQDGAWKPRRGCIKFNYAMLPYRIVSKEGIRFLLNFSVNSA